MKTLVLYQFPKATHDIFTWAQKHEICLDSDINQWEIEREHKGRVEYIKIIPISRLHKHLIYSKLIIYGAVTKVDLIKILHYTKEDNG